ncbi:MAG: L,D-transpeptidase family protein [Sphingobacteriaceae bacterium]|nr:L,D-transpeptidase family protein [Sphingobacteriaceae bacterium]
MIRISKFLLVILVAVCIQSCNWFENKPLIGSVLADHFDNKLFNKFDTAAYNPVFRKQFLIHKNNLKYAVTLHKFYEQFAYEPSLITKFYANGNLTVLLNYLEKSNSEGLNPNYFKAKQFRSLLADFAERKFKTIEEVYPIVAQLELLAADSYLRYHNALSFGMVNPKDILPRCYLPILRPTVDTMLAALATEDLSQSLLDLQLKDASYLLMKNELKSLPKYSVKYKSLVVNLERLRWKYSISKANYILINIPDFTLTWFANQDTVSYMKVCVGAKRDADFDLKYAEYVKSKNLDSIPNNFETSLLVSEIEAVVVNPTWNIPLSIAKKEIYKLVIADPFYLSNRNINVYYKGKKIENSDTIQWANYDRNKFPFKFKQGAGDGNALGKFKFIFDNNAGIYLHDTDNKTVFNLKNRALSHGCIRLEKPYDFAEHLIANAKKFDKLRLELGLSPSDTTNTKLYKAYLNKKIDTNELLKVKPKWFSPQKNVLLMINYFTAWVENHEIKYRNDIYGYDEMMWNYINK